MTHPNETFCQYPIDLGSSSFCIIKVGMCYRELLCSFGVCIVSIFGILVSV